MEFKDILVHIDNLPQCAARLDVAIKLATRHKARLTGLYAVTHPHHKPQGEKLRLDINEAEEMFRRKASGAGVRAEWFPVDWGISGVTVAEMLSYYAHQKDLIIISQTDPERLEGDVPQDLPERLVLSSGRPVLVVPYAGTFDVVGENVIVAWKAGRASARAVNDAMPILLNARQVNVLSIKAAGEQGAEVNRPDGSICEHLKLYNIRVKEENLVTGEIPVANILMNYAWENGCDLIVVGAYAYTRGTFNLGPVARHLLDHMTLPVLMSH